MRDESPGTADSDWISVGDIRDARGVAIGAGALGVSAGRDVNIDLRQAFPRPDYRGDVASLISFYTKTFVGRVREWNRLTSFASERLGGYLVVEAPPGYGKSALLAELIHRHGTGRWRRRPVPDLLYFFV